MEFHGSVGHMTLVATCQKLTTLMRSLRVILTFASSNVYSHTERDGILGFCGVETRITPTR